MSQGARKVENVLSSTTQQRKGKAKGVDQEARSKVQQNDNMPGRQGEVHLEKKIVLRVSTTRGNCCHDRACDCWYPPHCKYFKTEDMSNGKGLSIHTLKKEVSIYQSERKRYSKEVRIRESSGCNCECCKSPSEDHSKLPTSRMWRQSTMPMESILALCRKLPSEKAGIRNPFQSLERAKFRNKFPSLNVIQTSSKNARSPNAPPYDRRSTAWNEEQEEFARHRAYKLHKALLKTKGQPKDVHKTNFSRSYVSTKAKNTATGLAIHSKERMYIVDSDASLHFFDQQREKYYSTVKHSSGFFRAPMPLWSKPRSHANESLRIKELGAYLWIHFWSGRPRD